jgi:hypothetical protein
MPDENEKIPHEDDEQRGDPAMTPERVAFLTALAEAIRLNAGGTEEAKPQATVVVKKSKTFPCRVWHKKGQYGARLVSSQVEINALGDEWTDEAPKKL